MEQQRALNSLEPYLVLSKNARTPASAAELISQATADAQTFVFAELLQTPTIQSLRSSDHARDLTLLEIFAWGTWMDYKSTPDLPVLNAAQSRKLKQLSLVSLLSNPIDTGHSGPKDVLSYDFLQHHLDIESQSDLEKLLTSALSSGLITGHLDPLHRRVAIVSVAPLRDLLPGSGPQLISVLSDWGSRCDSILQDMEAQMEGIRSEAQKRGMRESARKIAFEKEIGADEGDAEDDKDGGRKMRSKRKEPGGRGAEVMDVDDDDGKGTLRGGAKAKKLFGKRT